MDAREEDQFLESDVESDHEQTTRRERSRRKSGENANRKKSDANDNEVTFRDGSARSGTSYHDRYQNDPEFQEFMNDLVAQRIGQDGRRDRRNESIVHRECTPARRSTTPVTPRKRGISRRINHNCNQTPIVKSPSDSTLYTSALKHGKVDNQIIDRISNFVDNMRLETQHPTPQRSPIQPSPISRPGHSPGTGMGGTVTATPTRPISESDQEDEWYESSASHRSTSVSDEYVSEGESVASSDSMGSRYRQASRSPSRSRSHRRSRSHSQRRCKSRDGRGRSRHRWDAGHRRHRHRSRSRGETQTLDRYHRSKSKSRRKEQCKHVPHQNHDRERKKDATDQILIDAEKKRANLLPPKGRCQLVDENIQLLRALDNDDDFFHVTYHIDSNLKQKIKRGEFVDLEKLLPKDKLWNQTETDDKSAIEIVTRVGRTFLATPQHDSKITGVRKWDQAFCIYVMIYCQANPNRSSEILQYVDVIHNASMNYAWDNVATYDFTFHQLMASKPWWSWAKTYSQGWNIALKGQANMIMLGGNQGKTKQGTNLQTTVKNWRENCCWKYNKNRCKKSNSDCQYDHRCTYCGGWNHTYHNCRKRGKISTNSLEKIMIKNDNAGPSR